MSTTDRLILFVFGAIAIASVFMVFGFAKIARQEFRDARRHGNPLHFDRPFLLSFFLVGGALALIGIGLVRSSDGLMGLPLGGSNPRLMLSCLILLLGSWTGFHWSATFDRARWSWRFYLALVVVWGLSVVLLTH